MGRTWQETAKFAQELRDRSIAEVQPPVPEVPSELPSNVIEVPRTLLSEAEVALTEESPEKLLAALATGEVSSSKLILAFLRRAGVAQKLTNCITELLPTKALERAKFLDDYLAEKKRPIGPLHGLPISVKEHVGMKGLGLNAAFVAWWDNVAEDDALILKYLWNAGCVFYARTTQPQLLMHLETSSNLYGETVNPYNRALTSGGSSGGEGALIALRGSCMGIGTDIGGSIRSPAANCGVYGFRPSTYRLPLVGCLASMLGEEQIVPVIGPLSSSFEGLKIFMKTIIDQKPWLTDPSMLPFPWQDYKTKSLLKTDNGKPKLKVAIMWHDGVVMPHPPITRGLREVEEKLKGVPGIELVDWKPHKHDQAWEIISSLYFCDGGKEDIETLAESGEPWRPLSNFIVKEQTGVKDYSVSEVWRLTIKREQYKAEYAKAWNDTAIAGDPETTVDVILCPAGPGTAPPLDHARYWGYTSQWNLLDYPALIFPVTKVDQGKDTPTENFKPMSSKDEWNHSIYSPEKYTDAPVSLQLVGRRYDDEKVFEAFELIKDAVGLPFVTFP